MDLPLAIRRSEHSSPSLPKPDRTNPWPGLFVGASLAIAAWWLASFSSVSTLTVAVVLGITLGNLPIIDIDALRPGFQFAAKHILRVGVILLGMRLSIGQLGDLGLPVIGVIAATVIATFFGTQVLGRRLGVSGPLSLLIATGYSICGASAVAAMESTTDAEEEEVAAAIGLVTLAGTVAMFAVPAIGAGLSLTDDQFAIWAGASIHDVAQVVAAGATRGPEVLAAAVVVKLTRVLLLAPLVAGVSLTHQRSERADSSHKPWPIPAFVLGFIGLVAIRSTGLVPETAIATAATVERMVFAVALVGLGAGVRIGRLRQLGGAPLMLGTIASLVVGGVSLASVLLIT